MKDAFSKDMFGTDEVTVTVEYDGPNDEQEDNTLAVNENEERELDDEELLKDDENEEDPEDELNEEEEKIIENITYRLINILLINRLSDKEKKKILEQANSKKKKGKGRRRRNMKKHSHHWIVCWNSIIEMDKFRKDNKLE